MKIVQILIKSTACINSEILVRLKIMKALNSVGMTIHYYDIMIMS